jgi:hypothetical protein
MKARLVSRWALPSRTAKAGRRHMRLGICRLIQKPYNLLQPGAATVPLKDITLSLALRPIGLLFGQGKPGTLNAGRFVNFVCLTLTPTWPTK